MPDIVLTTLNARYAHAAFGLRYLLANLGPLRERAQIIEFDIAQRTNDALEIILAQNPRIVGIGVYIWNAEQSLRLVADLKRLRPDIDHRARRAGGFARNRSAGDLPAGRLCHHRRSRPVLCRSLRKAPFRHAAADANHSRRSAADGAAGRFPTICTMHRTSPTA